MKINEVADVKVHPAVRKEQEFVNLLSAGEEAWDEMAEFIMDDRNADARRLHVLRHLDELQGDVKDHYDASDLEDFMHDQGPSDWRSELRKSIEAAGVDKDSYSWSHKKDYPVDWENLGNISDEEMIELAKDLKIPPYHLSPVEEQFDDETPTGEYEICQRCGGEGCIECEEGLNDITGQFKIPDLNDL